MFTTVEIAEVTGGKLLGGSVTVTGVSTDTRTIAPGMLFVAIRGESFNGNDYIGAAAEKGAAAAISDRSSGADWWRTAARLSLRLPATTANVFR